MSLALVEAPSRGFEPMLEPPLRGDFARGGILPGALGAAYGGHLTIGLRHDRPTVVANFVSTLDGVVSYNTPEAAGGGEISGFFAPDRFLMGLLRALADVVLVGAGTVRAAATDRWTPAAVDPANANDYAALRTSLGLSSHPVTAVVTASGELDLAHPGLADPSVPVTVITTERGAEALRDTPRHVSVHSVGGDSVSPQDLLAALAESGAELVVCEGGPHLLGQLVAARLIDELFLTVAPQVAGRSTDIPRLSLIEETAFAVSDAPWAALTGLRRAGDHLFLRYSL